MFIVEIEIKHDFSEDTLVNNPTYGDEDPRPFLDGVGHFFHAYGTVRKRTSFMGIPYKKEVLDCSELIHIAKYPKKLYHPALAYQEISKHFIENGEDMINQFKEKIAEKMVLRGLVTPDTDFSRLIDMHLGQNLVFETGTKEVNTLYKKKLERDREKRTQSE